MRPIILSGIVEFVRRGDLSDCSLYLHPPTIHDDDRRLERKLMADFDREHPLILRSLLDAVGGGLRTEPLLVLPRLSRIADFAHFGESVCQGLEHAPATFLAAYERNRKADDESALDDSSVARTLRALTYDAWYWTATAAELLDELLSTAGENTLASKSWPRTPTGLSSGLRRIAPQLRTTGITVKFDRDKYKRTITVNRMAYPEITRLDHQCNRKIPGWMTLMTLMTLMTHYSGPSQAEETALRSQFVDGGGCLPHGLRRISAHR